jgi:ABC-type multidrug transport system fused ATPase/permease subunit
VINDTGIWMAVLGVAAGLLLAGVAVIAVFFSQGTAYVLRTQAFASIEEFSFGTFDRMRTGNLLVRLSSEITNVSNAVLYGVLLLMYAPFMLLVSLALAAITAPGMVWILLVVTVVVLAAAACSSPMERAYAERRAVSTRSTTRCRRTSPACAWSRRSVAREAMKLRGADRRCAARRLPQPSAWPCSRR